MNKLAFFLESLRREHFTERSWCIRVMGIPVNNFVDVRPMQPCFENGRWYTHDDDGVEIAIEGGNPGFPLFERDESITLQPLDLPNVSEVTVTAYSTAIVNVLLFVWPFKKWLPYKNERFLGKDLDTIIETAIRAGDISIEELTGNFTHATGRLTAFTQIAVTAATLKTIRPSKRALAKRDELHLKYKDSLDDAATLAIIDTTVAAIDKEDMKGDEAERFFIEGKAFNVVRKKMFTTQGGIARMDGTKMDLLPGSLEEGLTPEGFASAVNDLRMGTESRAKDTAFGGEAAKFANRVFQNLRIVSEFCGTTVGLPVLITKDNAKLYKGRYMVGEDTPIDEAKLTSSIGKTLIFLSPAACKEKGRNFCEHCMGESVVTSGIKLGAQLGAVCNVFMSVSLAAFHGKALSTVQAIAKDNIR